MRQQQTTPRTTTRGTTSPEATPTPTPTAAPPTDLEILAGGAVAITIGARTVTLHPLDLNDLAAFEVEVGPLSAIEDPKTQVRAVRFVLWRSLLHEDPNATLEDAGRLVGINDLDALGEAMRALFLGGPQAGPASDRRPS
jgi:hypothetical protein